MTTADEVGQCPECGSTDKGTRYLIIPATYCKNAWHHVPPDYRYEFTALEFEFILGLCWGGPPTWRLTYEEIGKQLGIATQDIFFGTLATIGEKTGGLGSLDFREFARTALNNELRRRVGRGESA